MGQYKYSNTWSGYIPKSRYLLHQIRKHWYKPVTIAVVGAVMAKKDFSFDISFNAKPNTYISSSVAQSYAAQKEARPMNTSLIGSGNEHAGYKIKAQNVSQKSPVGGDKNLANTYSNMTYGDNYDPKKAEKRRKQLKYVKQFAAVAQKEMNEYGIPASIKLAQGLLESNVGESKLAVRNNNHFGIKCFSKSCKKGHCSNFTDDSHKDFFRIYGSSWESYRAHSRLLQKNRYLPLKKLGTTDYRGWARGLKKAGYATDPRYAEKIIGLIEDLHLHEYDR